jgi:hypothetical protein
VRLEGLGKLKNYSKKKCKTLGVPFNENSGETYISIIKITVLIIIPAFYISQTSSDIEKTVTEPSTKILIDIQVDRKLNVSIKYLLSPVEKSNKF